MFYCFHVAWRWRQRNKTPATKHQPHTVVSGVNVCLPDYAWYSFHLMVSCMSSPNCECVILSDPGLMTGWLAPGAVIALWIGKYWYTIKYHCISALSCHSCTRQGREVFLTGLQFRFFFSGLVKPSVWYSSLWFHKTVLISCSHSTVYAVGWIGCHSLWSHCSL